MAKIWGKGWLPLWHGDRRTTPLACPSRNGIRSLLISLIKRTYSSRSCALLSCLDACLHDSCAFCPFPRIKQVQVQELHPQPKLALPLELEKGGPKGFQIRYVSTSHFRIELATSSIHLLVFGQHNNPINQLLRAPGIYHAVNSRCYCLSRILLFNICGHGISW